MTFNNKARTMTFCGLSFKTASSTLLSSLVLSLSLASHAQSLDDNLRLSLDLSSRVVNFDVANEVGSIYTLGIDLHKVFSGPQGDVGTLVLQGYMTQLNNQVKHPPFFENENDSQLVYRIFNFNFTALGSHLPNIRAGHFEIPYGLEHTINTNGTLRDYTHGPNLGVKADWGISLNKEMQHFEYELSYTNGGVQEVDQVAGSYVYAARIGTPRDDNWVLGLAVFDASLGEVNKQRLGLDGQFYAGAYGVFAQLDNGKNGDVKINNAIVEFNWRNANESYLLYLQNFYFSKKMDTDTLDAHAYTLGIRLEPDNHWDMSAQIKQDLTTFSNDGKDTQVSAQLRYRF
jgi:hypothetical protein